MIVALPGHTQLFNGVREFVLQFLEGALRPFILGKLVRQTPKLGNLL